MVHSRRRGRLAAATAASALVMVAGLATLGVASWLALFVAGAGAVLTGWSGRLLVAALRGRAV